MRLLKALIIILFLFAIVDLLRETGILTIEQYDSSINADIQSNWITSVMDDIPVKKDDELWFTSQPKPEEKCNLNRSIRKIPVYAYFEDSDKRSRTDTCQKLLIKAIDFKTGPIWTPLYKKASFSVTGKCNTGINLYYGTELEGIRKRYYIKGDIEITGDVKIKGLCSKREAERIIRAFIIEKLESKSLEKLQEQKEPDGVWIK